MPRANPKLNVGPAEDRIRRILNFFRIYVVHMLLIIHITYNLIYNILTQYNYK